MSLVERYVPGDFCWTELCATNPAAAKRFYARLFGWTFREVGTEAEPYTMCVVGECDVAGMTPARGAFWRSQVCVADAAETARRAREVGGNVVAGPKERGSLGTATLVEDPTGGRISTFQPRAHRGAGRMNEPGAMCWNELATDDVARARRFYSELFGWTSNEGRIGAREYVQCFVGGARVAGIVGLLQNRGQPIPPQWLVYFAAASCDGTAALASACGGAITVAPTGIPGVGRFAALRDPQGAVFAIIELAAG